MYTEPYKIYCVTWNVHQRVPPVHLDLRDLLATTADAPDIYAIGLQEVDMQPRTIIKSESTPDVRWIEKLLKAVHPAAEYEELETVRLVGMMLTIIVKRSIRNSITKVCSSSVGTGKFKLGNKGGIGVSFELNDSSLCFVNSHFAAHVNAVERRNSDYDEILRKIEFSDGFRRRSILEHDQIYWMGDLNYRMMTPTNELNDLVKRICNHEKLFYLDQFYIQYQQSKRVFKSFHEGRINFPPTYKYQPLTDEFSNSRAAAWCDRILWKGLKIEQIKYKSAPDIRLSDHKPVYAVFIGYI